MRIGTAIVSLLLAACSNLGSDPSARTPGVVVDDEVLERLAESRIRDSDPAFDTAHLVAVSYNGLVLLVGQVANADLKEKASEVVQQIDKVRTVHNELEVGAPISFVARTNDSWLTTKVKAKLLAEPNLHTDDIKVVTENSVVYLLGIVEREEANQAVNAASTVYGVQKIVKVFEYLSESA